MQTPYRSSREVFEEAKRELSSFLADDALIASTDRLTSLLAERFRAERKVLICGNGGSACDAAHFAEELTGRFRKDRPPLAAVACTDAGHITCTANDYGFEEIFARWVTALGKQGDVLIVLSTSGNSPNIRRAIDAAKEKGMTPVALLGRGGGKTKSACDLEIIVPGSNSERIQELHMLVLHAVVDGVEARLFNR
jgi:D-sedoheptulose 7-phosphate isomerase